MNEPESLLAVLDVYRASLAAAYQPKSAANRFNRLQCALRRVLQPDKVMLAPLAQAALEQMPVSALQDAWSNQPLLFEHLQVSESLREVDRGALRNFLAWCLTHPWWAFGDPFLGSPPPPLANDQLSLAAVLQGYEAAVRTSRTTTQADNHLRTINTAIRRYLLLGLGLPVTKGSAPTQAEKAAAQQLLEQTSCQVLRTALQTQEDGFQLVKASAETRKVARSALQGFLTWSEQQPWWLFGDRVPLTLPEQKRYLRGHGHFLTKRSTRRDGTLPDYGLRLEDCPAPLQSELLDFKAFWTDPPWKGAREIVPIRPRVLQGRQQVILRLLGWLHRYVYQDAAPDLAKSGVPLVKMSLERLVPVRRIKHART